MWERRGKGGKGGEDRGGEGEGEGKGTGREGTPNVLLHPQFQFSRNMAALQCNSSIFRGSNKININLLQKICRFFVYPRTSILNSTLINDTMKSNFFIQRCHSFHIFPRKKPLGTCPSFLSLAYPSSDARQWYLCGAFEI